LCVRSGLRRLARESKVRSKTILRGERLGVVNASFGGDATGLYRDRGPLRTRDLPGWGCSSSTFEKMAAATYCCASGLRAAGDSDDDGGVDVLMNCVNALPQLRRCDSQPANYRMKLRSVTEGKGII
jgi:hypothetical protein